MSPVGTHLSQNYVTLINQSVRPYYKRAFIHLCVERERFDIADVRNRCKDMTGTKTSVSTTQLRIWFQV